MPLQHKAKPQASDCLPATDGRVQPCLADRLLERRDWSWAALILLLAIAWGCYYLARERLLTSPAAWEEMWIAQHLAHGHGFRSPFDPSPTAPPSSWSPPLYPLLASLVFRALGTEGTAPWLTLHLLSVACYGLVAAGLFVLGRLIFFRLAGLCAAALFCIHPLFLAQLDHLWDHYPALAAFIWLTVAATWIARRGPTLWRLAALGVGTGLLVQLNASYVLAVPLLVLIALAGLPLRKKAAYVMVSIVGFSACLAPWTLRNYHVFHRVFFVRAGAPLELWFGNLPGKSGWYDADSWKMHPGLNAQERRLLLSQGEIRYFDLCAQRFRDEARRDPGAFALRTLRRVGYAFMGNPTFPAKWPILHDARWHGIVLAPTIFNALVLLLALAGTALARRHGYRAGWIIPLGLLGIVPMALAGAQDRHLIPLRAMLVLAAAFAMAWACQASLRRPRPLAAAPRQPTDGT